MKTRAASIEHNGSPSYMPWYVKHGNVIKWFLLCMAILVLVRGGCKGYFISLT